MSFTDCYKNLCAVQIRLLNFSIPFNNFTTFQKQYASFVITSINTYVTITAHTREALWGDEWKHCQYKKTEKSNNY